VAAPAAAVAAAAAVGLVVAIPSVAVGNRMRFADGPGVTV